ncbi:Proline-rich receptor-like protein kinase PERK10 [Acorus calamus]|uniref:Proline-rich receptor-like protein kinase PERK10 n=1 Tax=Acorus calamus TaxID=4465 RepID=A0AAV9DLY1_ACOCL|nr:Proline-rich receptor-like protein kinase PERK10 [Acorus calamus]
MRPRMGQVARALDFMGDSSDIHNGMRAGQSELLNSARQSSEIRLFQRMASDNQYSSTDFDEMAETVGLSGGVTGFLNKIQSTRRITNSPSTQVTRST